MKRIHKLALLTFVSSLVLVACDTNNNQSPTNVDDATEMLDVAQEADRIAPELEEGGEGTEAQNTEVTDPDAAPEEVQQYLIFTAHIDYESVSYDEARQEIEALLQEFQAMPQYVNESQYEPYSQTASDTLPMMRYLNATYRIPQEEFDQVMSRLLEIEAADVVSSTQGSEDATRSVMDLDIRIQAAEDRLERLNQLLEQAEEIEDILAIQAEVENAIIERDQYLAERSNITNRANLSTVTLSLREVYMTQVDENEAYNFSNRVQTTFRNAIIGTRRLFQELILLLISLIPILVLVALLFLIYWILIRPFVKRWQKNRPTKDSEGKARKRKVPSFAPNIKERKANNRDQEVAENSKNTSATNQSQSSKKAAESDKTKAVIRKPRPKNSSEAESIREKRDEVNETASDKPVDSVNLQENKIKNQSKIKGEKDPLVADPDNPDPTTLNPPLDSQDDQKEDNKDIPENPS